MAAASAGRRHPVPRNGRRHWASVLALLAKAVAALRHKQMLRQHTPRVREEDARRRRAAACDPQAPPRKLQTRSLQAEDADRAAAGLARAAGPTWGVNLAAMAAAAANQSVPASRLAVPGSAARRSPSIAR